MEIFACRRGERFNSLEIKTRSGIVMGADLKFEIDWVFGLAVGWGVKTCVQRNSSEGR